MIDAATTAAVKPVVARPPGWKYDWGPAALLALLTFLVFCPVLRHRFIESWDDSTAILLNRDYNPPHLRNLIHYWTRWPETDLFYVPITYSIWGLVAFIARGSAPPGLPFNPAFFYAVNLLAHVSSSVVVYLILRRLVPSRAAAWLGAAVFALHPIQVEAVANAWTMYTPLSAALGFFAIWQYLIYGEQRFDRHEDSTGSRHGSAWAHFALATVAFAAALLTKPTAATVPLMIATIEVGFRGRKPRTVALPMGIWLFMALFIFLINDRVSGTAHIFVPNPLFRSMVPLDAIAFYLGKILLPVHLVMDYGRTPFLIAGHPHVQWTCILTVALLAAAWALRKRWPWLLTSLGLFVFALVPTIGIFPFTFQYFSTVADRYVYLAMLGPALAVAVLLNRIPLKLALTGGLPILTLLAGMSVAQLRHWRDDWQVAAYALKVNPKSNAATAIFQYLFTQKFHRDDPAHPFPAPRLCSLSQSELLQVGDSLFEGHYYEVAVLSYRQALREGLGTAKIYARLGMILERDCKPVEAKDAYQRALSLDPDNDDARNALEKISGEL